MTNKELDNLDRLCAIYVMGFKTEHPPAALHPTPNPTYLWAHGVCVGVTGHQHSHRYWSPTRNIAQAWECLEQMISLGWIAETSQDVIDYMLIKMWKNEENHPTIAIPISVTARAPEAIVLACLKAKGVSV